MLTQPGGTNKDGRCADRSDGPKLWGSYETLAAGMLCTHCLCCDQVCSSGPCHSVLQK